MIDIKRKEDCVGCGACVQRCPKRCIEMHEDEQGFLYPKVNLELCIDCHLCEKVCPVINQAEPRKPLKVYAAKNTDEAVRLASSSGGIFFALAKYVIDKGGVVFGARFNDNWEVVHGYAETIDGVKAFQGSKYVQSRIGDSYQLTESFLKGGRIVMFTGTPCQLAGLRLFLRKDYGEQLLSVDVVCHGVPSPLVWREYLKYITRPKEASVGKNSVLLSLKDKPVITGISFRDKRLGWEKYGFSVRMSATDGSGQNTVSQSGKHENFRIHFDDSYFFAFNASLTLRPSCFACPNKSGKAGTDISLGDFWHINDIMPDINDDKGVSVVLANTQYGERILKIISVDLHDSDYSVVVKCVPSIARSVSVPEKYALFWKEYANNGIRILPGLVRYKRLIRKFVKCPLKMIIGDNTISQIRKILNR